MKKIKSYNNYNIDEYGNIINIKTGRQIKAWVTGEGYLSIQLWKNGKGTTFSVHRLVAQTFIPNPENKPIVHHKDSNRRNNHFSNLKWTTDQENTNERITKKHKGKLSKKRIMKLYRKRKWNSVEDFIIELFKQ